MPLPEFFIEPVVELLAQSQSPYDVPADPTIFDAEWLAPTRSLVLALLTNVSADAHAGDSVTGAGLTYLSVGSDAERDYSVHLRLAGEGLVVPRSPEEKAVILTLAGVMELEAFRHEDDVSTDTPWYVRQFEAGRIYASHPGTIHSVEQSADAVQLAVSRGAVPAVGRRLGASDFRDAVLRAQELLQSAIELDTHEKTAVLSPNPSDPER
ncbi:hypothetical protein GII33_06880 [Gordonia pseudamarae]|jgi:hypothetical protein|uniref:Uncharacterized protein n=1 Tax=Gordonia pseudamarae TaxID=2831662 RepID=A0ABX6IFR7_9ACTN|nr:MULTISPECIES: hypothetical protein [Gordonia]MBD0020417.1 hypothetical protein [Gordonia sp. (in: high G+C Gram-positive bacteria)]QHN25726.1 hypothetical protein GII33_06880 [Gordonia pseudamarae]QHN34658.1 hypothetical protein GII31_06855 [Gordonia pseudamarae]